MKKMKMQVVFPQDLLMAVNRAVTRRKRSAFIVEAARRELRRQCLAQAVEKAAGSWSDGRYPEFATFKDLHRWRSQFRTGYRIERLQG